MTTNRIQSNNSDIMKLLYQSYLPRILNCAIEINVFEVLSQDALQLSELSERLKTVETITGALLDVLVAIELVTRQENRYSLTQKGKDFFLSGSAANLVNVVKGFPGSAGPFDNLTQVLQKGAPDFNSRMWGNRESILNMEQQQNGGAIQAVLSFISEIPEFGTCKKMCDFAGSIGYFSFALMQENQQLKSHVYDLPEVCALAVKIKENEENYNRITYHDFDIASGESFGNGYDLFFSSHFLYGLNAEGTLSDFFKKVNRSMEPGGLFISNHITSEKQRKNSLTLSIIELMTRSMGYPTHMLPEDDLKSALSRAGFKTFRTKYLEKEMPYPTLLLAAVKTEEM
ncbi:MAG: methyltransferase dimerization domain-containing protein [Desulfobacteraceae bacterium]